MNYNLPVNDQLVKDVMDLYTYDIEWSGGDGAMSRLMDFLWKQTQSRAISVCTETVKGEKGDKAFDRGYVKGLHEFHNTLLTCIRTARSKEATIREKEDRR